MQYTQDLRAFGSTRDKEVVITIKEVYNHYYTGYLESENKFYKFVPTKEGLRQQIWNSDERKMELVPLSGTYTIITGYDETTNKPQYGKAEVNSDWFWKGFYKLYKKVYDIKLTTDTSVSPLVYNKETKAKEPTVGTEFVIQGVGAPKLRNIILSCVDEYALEEAEKAKDFEWESKYDLENTTFKFSVTGKGLDTKYTFKPAKPKKAEVKSVEEEIVLEDLPF